MSQGVLCQKNRFLGKKLWPLACEHTDRHTHRGFKNRAPIRASVFKASASGMSGPIKETAYYILNLKYRKDYKHTFSER